MTFNPDIIQGSELTNKKICTLFGCSLFGGMNRSLKTNTLVLVTNRIKCLYQDRIDEDIIHYTGMGQKGNQDLNDAQNKTLNESITNGVGVHLFEVIEQGKYIYVGKVQLAGKAYEENQLDTEGNDRLVWMFPLQLSDSSRFVPVELDKVKNLDADRARTASKLSPEELLRKAKQARKIPGSRQATVKQYQRNEYVAEEAKRRANGICQLCLLPAPFTNKNKKPYLEVHHIVWLARVGNDSLENTVALCPNCHRKMHVLDDDTDKKALTSLYG
ncbi:HNH endonuclease [Methylobacter psychrophilus]|uniref:HNH endonuclease n=1 Tax=Methylobacter psychrophilus TaxID=96941 RepID=UPI0021D4F54C|nr:HNH endonuclease [Methylobacter psychrophilus]